MQRRYSLFGVIVIFLGGLVLLFIIAPLAGMFLSVDSKQLSGTLSDAQVISSIRLTLWTSMLATLLFAVGAVPLAWFLARKEFPGKKFVLGLINVPIVIPHTAAGIAILGFISRDSVVGQTASYIGLDLIGNPASIILAMAFVSVPFLLNASIEAFNSVPEKLEKSALNLGASPSRVFFSISLPLAWRGILTGAVMMWARGMSEFGAVVIVAYHPMITPVLIYERFASFGLRYATPVAVVFVVVTLLFFVLMRMISRSGKLQSR